MVIRLKSVLFALGILAFVSSETHAKDVFPINKTGGYARCTQKPPIQRTAVLEGNTLTISHSRLGPCSGPVNADGSFAFMCAHVGNIPSLSYAGKISSNQIKGTQKMELVMSAPVDLNCTISFEGVEDAAQH